MNYRYATLLAEKSFTADAAETIDINIADPISRIRIELRAYCSISQGTDEHVAKILKKVELVDGSEVLFSLDGRETYALQFYQTKTPPADRFFHIAGNWVDITFLLDFGRWLFDADLALDPKKFDNLQLKIETDQDAGGATTTAHRLEVMALCFDQKVIAPAGMLTAKRIKEYTMGSATHEYTNLPTDRKYRRLMVRTSLAGTELSQTLEYIKLTEDNDKHVICNHTVNDLIRAYPEENAPYFETFHGNCGTGVRIFHCTPGVRGQGTTTQWSTSVANCYASCGGPEGMVAWITGSAAMNFACNVKGWCPMNSISIPMGDEWDPADWFDPSGLQNLKLDLLSLAAGSTYACQIFAQQLRLY